MTGRGRIVGLVAIAVAATVVALRLTGRGPDEGEVTTDVAVHVATVERATLHRYVTAYGTVEPEPPLDGRGAGGALVTPFVDGVLASVDCEEGATVAEGAVLFRLDSRMAEVAVERVRAQAEFAEAAFQRQEQLLASDGTSQRAYQEARRQRDVARGDLAAAETALAYLTIRAPVAGTVTQIGVRVGEHVDATTTLARVVDLDRLVVDLSVPEREIAGVAVGRRVLLASADDGALEGVVRVVGRDVDPTDGTYRVLVSVPAGSGLSPGRFTEVRIVAEERADVLVVPEVTVVTRPEEGTWIMVVDGERAVRLPVTAGLHDRGLVEVSGEGLEEGRRIVTDDAYSLPEETRIHIVGG